MTACAGLHGCGGHGLTVAVITDAQGHRHPICAACIADIGHLVHKAGTGYAAQVVTAADVRIVRVDA